MVNKNTGESIPVVIYPADYPITTLLDGTYGYEYEDNVSSTAGLFFPTKTKILRVGNTFAINTDSELLALKKETFSNVTSSTREKYFDRWLMLVE